MSTELSEALAAQQFSAIDGIALDAVISGDPDQISAAKRALIEARREFAGTFLTFTFAEFRNQQARIAAAGQLLN